MSNEGVARVRARLRPRWIVGVLVVGVVVLLAYAWGEDDAPANPSDYSFNIDPGEVIFDPLAEESLALRLTGNDIEELVRDRNDTDRRLTGPERRALFENSLFEDLLFLPVALEDLERLRPRRAGDAFPGHGYLLTVTVMCDQTTGTLEWRKWLGYALDLFTCGANPVDEIFTLATLIDWLESWIPHWDEDQFRTLEGLWPSRPFVPIARDLAGFSCFEFNSSFSKGATPQYGKMANFARGREPLSAVCRLNLKAHRTRSVFLEQLERRIGMIEQQEPLRLAERCELQVVAWNQVIRSNGLSKVLIREFEAERVSYWRWCQLGRLIEDWLVLESAMEARRRELSES